MNDRNIRIVVTTLALKYRTHVSYHVLQFFLLRDWSRVPRVYMKVVSMHDEF